MQGLRSSGVEILYQAPKRMTLGSFARAAQSVMAGLVPIGIRIRLGVEKISVFSAFAWGRRGGGGSGDRQAGWSERTDRPTHGRRHRLPVWRPATASVGHLQQAPQGEDSRKSWQMSSISRSIIR